MWVPHPSPLFWRRVGCTTVGPTLPPAAAPSTPSRFRPRQLHPSRSAGSATTAIAPASQSQKPRMRRPPRNGQVSPSRKNCKPDPAVEIRGNPHFRKKRGRMGHPTWWEGSQSQKPRMRHPPIPRTPSSESPGTSSGLRGCSSPAAGSGPGSGRRGRRGSDSGPAGRAIPCPRPRL